MSAEKPIPTPREEEVMGLNFRWPVNRAAINTVASVEETLKEQWGFIGFIIFPFKFPVFTSEPIAGGMGGLNVDIAFLDIEGGEKVYRERNLSLKFGMGDVDNPREFLNALKEGSIEQIGFSFKADKTNIAEDPDGRIVLQGVKVTDWEKKEEA